MESHDLSRYLEQISRTLAGGVLPDTISSDMGRQLALTLARITARISVNYGAGTEVQQQTHLAYMRIADDMLAAAECGSGDRLPDSLVRLQQLVQQTKPVSNSRLKIELSSALIHIRKLDPEIGRKWTQRLIDCELENFRTISTLTETILVDGAAKHPGGERFSPEQVASLCTFLKESNATVSVPRVKRLEPIPGGFSKETYIVTLTDAFPLPEQIVIRYDAPDSVFGATVAPEFGILSALHASGVHVARPYALEATGGVLGAPFMVTSKAEGRTIGDSYDVYGGSTDFGYSLARELAKLHTIPLARLPIGLRGAAIKTEQRLLNEITSFNALWTEAGFPCISMEVAFVWLIDNIAVAGGRRSLIHRDVGCHNLLVKDQAVTAILDWESAAIGNPAEDLGYCRKTIMQFMEWDDFLTAYVAAGGAPPSDQEIVFYDLWGKVWTGTYAARARALFRERKTDNIQLAYIGEHIFKRDMQRVSQCISELRL